MLDHEPRVVIYMCGCNDLYRGESPNRTVNGFMKFVDKLHAHLSDTQVIYVSVINSPLMVPPSPTPYILLSLLSLGRTRFLLAGGVGGEGRAPCWSTRESIRRVGNRSDPRLCPASDPPLAYPLRNPSSVATDACLAKPDAV